MNPAQGNTPNYAILLSRFSSSGQWDRVLDTAREWLSLNPENIPAHLAAGQALNNLDRHAEAELYQWHLETGWQPAGRVCPFGRRFAGAG